MCNKTCKRMDHGRVFVPHYTCLNEIKIKFRNTSTHPLKNQHVEFQSYKIIKWEVNSFCAAWLYM